MESHTRSIVKALSYRAVGFGVTAAVAWVLTRNVSASFGISLFDAVAKIGVYYAHERFWMRVSFGKTEPPEYMI